MSNIFQYLTQLTEQMPNMPGMENLDQLRQQMESIRASGEAGAGAVTVTLNGLGKMVDLQINQETFQDNAVLTDCIKAAFDRAMENLDTARQEQMMSAMNPGNLMGQFFGQKGS